MSDVKGGTVNVGEIDWWTKYKNAAGMDAPSRRCLLYGLKARRDEYARIRDEMIDRPEALAIWDDVFANETAAVIATIAEIEATLPENQLEAV